MTESDSSVKAAYIPINISVIEQIEGKLPFDVYIRRTSDRYTKLFNKGEEIDRERVLQYKKNKGVETLSVTSDDHIQYCLCLEVIAANVFAPKSEVTADDVSSILGEMINTAVTEIVLSHEISESDIHSAAVAAQGCVKVLTQDPKKFVDIFKLIARQPLAIKHSILVTIFSINLARLAGLESEKSLNIVAMGALLHDIGMSQLPYEAEEFDDMTAIQLREIKEHPQLGKKILDNIRSVPSEVGQIVLQHHEQPNGLGYPNHLGGTQIYMPAKIVSISDAFVTLTTRSPLRVEPFSALQAIQHMKDDINKYDLNLLRLFSDIFTRKNN